MFAHCSYRCHLGRLRRLRPGRRAGCRCPGEPMIGPLPSAKSCESCEPGEGSPGPGPTAARAGTSCSAVGDGFQGAGPDLAGGNGWAGCHEPSVGAADLLGATTSPPLTGLGLVLVATRANRSKAQDRQGIPFSLAGPSPHPPAPALPFWLRRLRWDPPSRNTQGHRRLAFPLFHHAMRGIPRWMLAVEH